MGTSGFSLRCRLRATHCHESPPSVVGWSLTDVRDRRLIPTGRWRSGDQSDGSLPGPPWTRRGGIVLPFRRSGGCAFRPPPAFDHRPSTWSTTLGEAPIRALLQRRV